ncbi:hypothetical protein AHP7_29 [Aeromonas phage AHPMCC7]|nr:hypothetical protein AHP7_29 [Aeromonas phage AHPMCC7]
MTNTDSPLARNKRSQRAVEAAINGPSLRPAPTPCTRRGSIPLHAMMRCGRN